MEVYGSLRESLGSSRAESKESSLHALQPRHIGDATALDAREARRYPAFLVPGGGLVSAQASPDIRNVFYRPDTGFCPFSRPRNVCSACTVLTSVLVRKVRNPSRAIAVRIIRAAGCVINLRRLGAFRPAGMRSRPAWCALLVWSELSDTQR